MAAAGGRLQLEGARLAADVRAGPVLQALHGAAGELISVSSAEFIQAQCLLLLLLLLWLTYWVPSRLRYCIVTAVQLLILLLRFILATNLT